jgi:hypothetical protein
VIQVDLLSAKAEPQQFYGGPFDVKKITAHVDAVEIELQPRLEYPDHGIRSRTRSWRSARVYISNEDVPQLVLALVNQISAFQSQLESMVKEVAGRKLTSRDIYKISDSHVDVDWDKLRRLLGKRSA